MPTTNIWSISIDRVGGRVARPVELQLAGDLHLGLHGELVEVGEALLRADDQRDAP